MRMAYVRNELTGQWVSENLYHDRFDRRYQK